MIREIDDYIGMLWEDDDFMRCMDIKNHIAELNSILNAMYVEKNSTIKSGESTRAIALCFHFYKELADLILLSLGITVQTEGGFIDMEQLLEDRRKKFLEKAGEVIGESKHTPEPEKKEIKDDLPMKGMEFEWVMDKLNSLYQETGPIHSESSTLCYSDTVPNRINMIINLVKACIRERESMIKDLLDLKVIG